MADCRSDVRCSSQAGSPMCTQRPSSRWSVISQRPRPRATTCGRCPAMRKGHSPRQSSHPGVAGPTAPDGDDLELRVEVAPDGGVVGHADAVLLLGVHRRAPCPASGRWSRRGAGAAPGAPRRRPERSSAACSDAVRPGREGDGHPGRTGRVGPGHGLRSRRRCRRRRQRPTQASRRQAAPNRPRTPHLVTPTVLLVAPRPANGNTARSLGPDRPGHHRDTGARVPDCFSSAGPGRALSLPSIAAHDAPRAPPATHSGELHGGPEEADLPLGGTRCRWSACPLRGRRGPERRSCTSFHTQAPAWRVGRRPSAAVMKAAA